MAKKKFDREILESKETLPTVETNAPAGRMQAKQQVANTMDATAVDPGDQPGLTIKKQDVPAQVTRTTKVAEVIKEAKGAYAGGSGSSGAAAMRAGSYSGTTPVMGDMSGSTQLGNADRSTTRTGKKLDSTAKHINYLYNEQVSVKYDESKPLAENPEATQGYNGTYRNEHARTQKKSGFVPADLYYDRSVDEIIADNIYPTMGQTVNDPCANQTIASYEGGSENGGYQEKSYPRGNYLGSALTVAFNSDGHLTKMSFSERDISVKNASVDVANVSAVNGIIDANVAELDRQRMDEKAGDELMPNWNPLPRSVKNPTATIGLLRDIEAMVGAEVFMAYRKTANFFSYQLNKAAKDGQKLYSPIGDMIWGCMDGTYKDPTVVGSAGDSKENYLGVKAQYLAGSPALMIELYDSGSKYNTKADYLLQPRGWRMHLQTADNNMNMFRVPEKFAKAVYSNECFSTIDKEYDPFLPVCITDKAGLAHPLAYNSFVTVKDGRVKSVPFKYKYANGSNNVYVMNVHHPIVEGLINYFESMGTKFVKLCGTDDITIPMVHSTLSASLWSLLILAATPFIMKSRLTSFIDVFDYEESTGEYPFSQLKSIKELDPKYAINYTGSDYNEPLVCGKMKPATAFRWVFPETYWVCHEYADEYDVVMPWYHCGQSYEVVDKKLSYQPDGAVMCFPSVRSGTRFGFLDTIYSMSEREVRLALDRQTVIPGLGKAFAQYSSGVPGTELSVHGDKKVEYRYGLATDGQIVANFEADADQALTLFDILSTPREMGWIIPAPNGVLTQMVTGFTSASSYNTGYANLDADFGNGETGCNGLFRIRYWQGTADGVNGVNKPASINVNRAMSLQQDYKVIINQRMVGNYRAYCSQDFIVSLASMFDATASNPATVNDNSLFKPFTNSGAAATESQRKQVSMQKYLWTRIQRLPFALNPFDCCPSAKATGADSVPADPYDFLYIFGCAGFRASDYNEDSFNREKYRLNLGMLFVNDPYYDESSLYRV